jgi:hypothetical protein
MDEQQPDTQQTAKSELPITEYKSHKVVRAAKILAVAHWADDPSLRVTLDELDANGTLKEWHADTAWVMRQPEIQVGGYIVVYEDIYVSYSPEKAFESSYTRVASKPVLAATETFPRTITGHEVNECNQAISITADELDPKNGAASHNYLVRWYEQDESGMEVEIPFQHGPIKEVGVNGITQEVLLAILIDRFKSFQSGPHACEENRMTLMSLEVAQAWQHARTQKRLARGVEGTHTV